MIVIDRDGVSHMLYKFAGAKNEWNN